jgi:hypothetical protein
MRKPKTFFRVLTESGPLVALAVAIALLVGIAGPASAQFFNFGGFGAPQRARSRRRWRRLVRRRLLRAIPAAAAPQARMQDFSRRAGPQSAIHRAERNVLVLGDGMADWLAYGLEDAYTEQPDMGVIRKHKTASGLIKYQPKGEPSDWAAAPRAFSRPKSPTPSSSCSASTTASRCASRSTEKSDRGRQERRQEGRRASRATRKARRKARRRKPTPPSPTTSRRYRMRRRCADNDDAAGDRAGKDARARRTASTNSATSAGSSSTAKKIEEMIAC